VANAPSARPAPAADVDPRRAYLPLDEIEPAAQRPIRPAELKPISPRAAQSMATARTLIDQQRYTEASLELERALRFDPQHPDLHRTLAQLHWQAGNYERAKSHAARALEANPDDAGVHYVLGRVAERAGERMTAMAAYRTALLCGNLGADPDLAALVHFHLAEALSVEGYLEAALSQYRAFEAAATAIGSSAHDAEMLTLQRTLRGSAGEAMSKVLEKLGRFSEAADEMSKSAEAFPDDSKRKVSYARLLNQAGRTDEAVAVIRSVPGDDEEALKLLLTIYEKTGQAERIVDELQARRSAKPDDSRLLLDLVEKLTAFGKRDQARRELQEFLERHPEVHAVRVRLFELFAAESAWPDALSTAASGIRLQPVLTQEWENRVRASEVNYDDLSSLLQSAATEDAVLTYLRGVLAVARDRTTDGERLFRSALERTPRLVPARYALATLYLASYRYSEALAVSKRREESTPEDARLEKVLGEIHERLDQADQAAMHFKAAIQMSPGDVQTMLLLARLYRRTDDSLSAQRQLRLLLDKDPSHDEGRETLALLYLQEGKLDATADQIEELKRRTHSVRVKDRAQALLEVIRSRDTESYRRALRESLEKNGPDEATLLALAESYDEFEQVQARDAYLQVLASNPDQETAALGVIFAEQRLLEWESAAERFKRLLPRRPNRHAWRLGWSSGGWRLGLLELYFSLHDYESAWVLSREQAARDDLDGATRTRYRLMGLEALRLLGRQDEALPLLLAWADEDSDQQDVWRLQVAREHQRRQQWEQALAIYEALYQRNQEDRSPLGDLIDGLIAAGRHERAAQYVLDWLEDDPENDDALGALVLVFSQQKRTDDALELLRNKLLLARDRERFQNMQLFVLDAADRHTEAVEWLESLIGGVKAVYRGIQEAGGRRGPRPVLPDRVERLPNEPFSSGHLQARLDFLQARLAGQMVAAKDFREAQLRIREWLEETENPQARFSYLLALVTCQREEGNESQAGETLQQALALQPDHVGLNNDVAYTWIDQGVQLEDAEKMIRFALSRDPQRLAYLDTYGWLLYKKGRFAEAIQWLRRAADVADPKERDMVVWDHLGDACWRLGRLDDAKRSWETAAALARERAEEEMNSDERRVRRSIQQKIDDAAGGRTPGVAELGSATEPK
jgi:tetratricopeptide (TPR) repeat protein